MPAAPLGPHSEAVRSADTRSGAKGADKYTLLAELGRGGMANVYLAVARGPSGFNKLVVLKCLRSDLSDDAELIALFLEEARVSARLNHPHVVQAYEVGEHAGRPVIVMEYLEGQTLASLVERATPGGRLPLSLHLRILVDALEGLHHAHELTDYAGKRLDLVHRDVSPQNIFVTFDGQVKVLDFGIAKIVNSQSQTSTGVLKGKVHYMAPEQMLCLPVDRRADLYAAGVMAWQAATGQRMWKDVTDLQVMTLVTNEGAPLPRTVNPAVSPALEAIIMKALARNPDDRYATALEFAAELESFMEDTGTGVSNRGLATLMRELFEDVRNETRAIVEAQLLEVGNGNDDSRPMIPPNLVRISTWPEERPLRTGTNAVATSTPAKASSRPRWLAAAVAIAFVLALACLALVMWIRGTKSSVVSSPVPRSAPSAEPPAARAVAPEPSVVEPAPSVTLTLSATPKRATMTLDGTALPTNPYKAVVPSDEVIHSVRAELAGYAPKTVMVAPGRDSDVVVVLEPLVFKGAPRSVPAPAPPPAQSAVGPSDAKASGSRCSPPYFIDAEGIKKFRPECL